MTMNLLEIVSTACDELGLQRPATIVNSVDVQVRQFLGLANREGRELQQYHDWTMLQNAYILNVSAPIVTTGNVAANSAVIGGIPDTTGIVANYWVCNGAGIPVSARVASVDSPTQVTLDTKATTTTTGVTLTFFKDTFPEPSDFDRFINETWWDRTNRWQLLGPDSPQKDEWHRSGVVTVGPRRHFRQIGLPSTNYRLWPPLSSVEQPINLVFEYVSKNWVLLADGTTANSFVNDSDMPIVDDNAILLGIKWRFWQIKGFDYAAMQAEQIDYVDRLVAQDGGAKTLSMAKKVESILISPSNIQDGFWPGGTGPNMS